MSLQITQNYPIYYPKYKATASGKYVPAIYARQFEGGELKLAAVINTQEFEHSTRAAWEASRYIKNNLQKV